MGDENERPGNGEESYSGGVSSTLMQDSPGLAAESNAVIAHLPNSMLLNAASPLLDSRSLFDSRREDTRKCASCHMLPTEGLAGHAESMGKSASDEDQKPREAKGKSHAMQSKNAAASPDAKQEKAVAPERAAKRLADWSESDDE